MIGAVRKFFTYALFYHASLKNRLLLYFLILVILPTSIISITIYVNSNQTIKENISTSVQKNLSMAESLLLQKFEEMNTLMDSIYLNPQMTAKLSAERPDDQVAIVNELADLDKLIAGYVLHSNSNSQYSPMLYMLDRPEYLQHNFSQYVTSLETIQNEPWYTKLAPKARYLVIGLREYPGSRNTTYTIMLGKRLFGVNNIALPYSALLTLEANLQDFNRMLSQLKPSDNSSILILDEAGNVVISPELALLHTNLSDTPYIKTIISRQSMRIADSYETSIDSRQSLVTYRSIKDLGWTVVSISPMGDLNGKLIAFRNVMYAVLAICMALAVIIAVLLSNSITRPILKVIRSMSYAKSGNFDMEVEYKPKDEFSHLVNQYNKMIRQIKELFDKLYVSEVKKKEAELKALQAQINPHFLYNTLDSINWIALRHKVPDISRMVTSLSDFFRYSLNKGNAIITVKDELKQVESYLAIQQIRFQERLSYTIRVEPEVYNCYTIKLILQPLVENSLIHGIERRLGHGEIHIDASLEEDWVRIMVTDNGIGADVDMLNTMLEHPQEESGKAFGLNNVNQRIRQAFGEKAGLRFTANEDLGVTVTVSFPRILEMEDLKHEMEDDYRR
ncbi:MAG: histidine kinase [Paenibacillaceae bacterium]|jgi:two-component system sensor histidine kinase YesM|nr:histidine kinase [Paenibacillaceae bacterium]